MATRSHDLSIVEAVETLSSIADLEFDRDIGIAQKHEVILGNEKIPYKTVHWLHEEDASTTVNLVRETFRVVLHYLRHFYKKEYGQVNDQKTLDGIKTIMVLVGEAAKKLDKYTKVFHQTQSVTDLKEYRQLQDFYRTKIARKIEEGVINKWILGLTLGKGKEGREITFRAAPPPLKTDKLTNTQHVFVDLETVKKDSEYELFFIRKENGSRFFSPRLLRNIKLVCDFGSYFGERKELDPLEQIKMWVDRTLHGCAREMIKNLGSRFNHYFNEVSKNSEYELVKIMNKALLALMLSSHSRNLMRYQPIKNCAEYFEDFQGFLRDALRNDLYQKWMAYPPKEENQLAFELIGIIHALCRSMYAQSKGMEEMKSIVQGLIQESTIAASREKGEEKKNKIMSRVAKEYGTLSKLIKHHPNGPLLKVMDILEDGSYHVFDPILQHNIPNQLYDLFVQDKRYAFLRLPAPIYQEFINKAVVNDEFRAFLRSCVQGSFPSKHLLINLQDRTSWREFVRCSVLEELQNQPDLENTLNVVTLAMDTDFYHQLAPYHQLNHADQFKAQFKELLLDESAGYFFPSKIKREELSVFIDGAFKAIHHLFFSSKNVLVREKRLDFIELFYIVLQLKLIEWLQPDSVSLTCKDGIDVGAASSASIFAFLKLVNNQAWSDADWQHLNYMLYAPALMIRERIMLPDRFNRMISALKVVDNAREEFGSDSFTKIVNEEFMTLFKTPILHPEIFLPR